MGQFGGGFKGGDKQVVWKHVSMRRRRSFYEEEEEVCKSVRKREGDKV